MPRTHSEEYTRLAYQVALTARQLGVRVSTAEIVEASRLLALYSALVKEMSLADYIAVFTASYAKRSGDEDKVKQAVLKVLHDNKTRNELEVVIRDLERLRLHFGDRVPASLSRVLRRSNPELKEAYVRLQLLGIIKRGRKVEYVVHESKALEIVKKLIKKYGSLDEALREKIIDKIEKGSPLITMLGDSLPNYVNLHDLSIDAIVKLYKLAKSSSTLREHISKELLSRIERGESPSDPFKVYDILQREGEASKQALRQLIEQEPKLAGRVVRDYGEQVFLDIVSKISSPEKAAEALAAAYSLSKKEKLAARALLEKGNGIRDVKERVLSGLSEGYARLSLAEEYIRKSLLDPQLREAYLDMARSELAKITAIGLEGEFENYLSELESAIEDPLAALKSITKRMKPPEALQFLASVASANPQLKQLAIRIAYTILHRLELSTGRKSRRKEILYVNYGRVEPRRTIYNFARLNYARIARVSWRKRGRNVLVLDKSGSMKEYAVYATLSAVAFAPTITRLVLFDSKVVVVDHVDKTPLIKLIEYILSTNYEGYTNIVKALEEASKGLSPSKLILISDLRQTVIERERSLEDVIAELKSKGWSVIVIAPPTVDTTVLSRVRGIVKRYYIVRKPDEVSKIAIRVISSSNG